jgi:hypothetical protein
MTFERGHKLVSHQRSHHKSEGPNTATRADTLISCPVWEHLTQLAGGVPFFDVKNSTKPHGHRQLQLQTVVDMLMFSRNSLLGKWL